MFRLENALKNARSCVLGGVMLSKTFQEVQFESQIHGFESCRVYNISRQGCATLESYHPELFDCELMCCVAK